MNQRFRQKIDPTHRTVVPAIPRARAPTLGALTIEWVSCLINQRGTNPPTNRSDDVLSQTSGQA